MVYCCMVWGCQNRPDREDCRSRGVSFHRLPVSDLSLLRSWIEKIGVTNYPLSRNLRICSEHFEIDSFVVHKDGRRVLKRTAVPSLFNFSPETTVQAIFPAFPLTNLTTDDLRALKAEPTTPSNVIAKMASPPSSMSPANLSLKTYPSDNNQNMTPALNGDGCGTENDHTQQLRWLTGYHQAATTDQLLLHSKNVDDQTQQQQHLMSLNNSSLIRNSATVNGNHNGYSEDSPAATSAIGAAETPGASSTVSTSMLANGQVVVDDRLVNGDGNADEEINIEDDQIEQKSCVTADDNQQPDAKRFKLLPQGSIRMPTATTGAGQYPLVTHHKMAGQRRPRQPRKAAVPRQTRMPRNAMTMSVHSNQQTNAFTNASSSPFFVQQTPNFANLLTSPVMLPSMFGQQLTTGDNKPTGAALDLSVRPNEAGTTAQTPALTAAMTAAFLNARFGGGGDVGRLRSLVSGYRESASFLQKAADELESFMSHLQSLGGLLGSTPVSQPATNGPATPLSTSTTTTASTGGSGGSNNVNNNLVGSSVNVAQPQEIAM